MHENNQNQEIVDIEIYVDEETESCGPMRFAD